MRLDTSLILIEISYTTSGRFSINNSQREWMIEAHKCLSNTLNYSDLLSMSGNKRAVRNGILISMKLLVRYSMKSICSLTTLSQEMINHDCNYYSNWFYYRSGVFRSDYRCFN